MQNIEALYKENNFPSRKRLYEILKENNIPTTYKQVSEFVDRQAIHQLHKQHRTVQTKQLLVAGSGKVNDEWQIDLLDYSKYSKKNNGFKWLFVVIDVFSRKAYIEPIKSKQPSDTYVVFKKIVEKAGKPEWVYHDQGKEWLGGFKLYCEKEHILHFTNLLHEHTSLSIIDRFSRTIKTMIEKYMTGNNTTSYLPKLPYLLNLYNNAPHSSIEGIRPSTVANNKMNLITVATLNAEKRAYNSKVDKNKTYKIAAGDSVRLQIDKKDFDKGYKVTFSKTVYRVVSINGNVAMLDNNKEFRIERLMKVPDDTVDLPTDKKDRDEQNIIARRRLRRELG